MFILKSGALPLVSLLDNQNKRIRYIAIYIISNMATLSDKKSQQQFYMSGILEYIIDKLKDEEIDKIRENYILTLTNSVNSAKEDLSNMTYLMEKGILDIVLSSVKEALQSFNSQLLLQILEAIESFIYFGKKISQIEQLEFNPVLIKLQQDDCIQQIIEQQDNENDEISQICVQIISVFQKQK